MSWMKKIIAWSLRARLLARLSCSSRIRLTIDGLLRCGLHEGAARRQLCDGGGCRSAGQHLWGGRGQEYREGVLSQAAKLKSFLLNDGHFQSSRRYAPSYRPAVLARIHLQTQSVAKAGRSHLTELRLVDEHLLPDAVVGADDVLAGGVVLRLQRHRTMGVPGGRSHRQ